MTNKNTTIAIIFLILLGAGYYLYSNRASKPALPTSIKNIEDKGVAVGVEGTGDFKINNIPIVSTSTSPTSPFPPPPEYRRTFTSPVYFNAEARAEVVMVK